MVLHPPDPEGVSVIICTYNGSARIEKVLQHLLCQKRCEEIPWEVILVDNNSTDDTAQIAGNFRSSAFPVRIVEEHNRGLTFARLKGIDVAHYEYLTFIDDDNYVNDNWVETVYQTFKPNSDISICGSNNFPLFEYDPPDWFHSLKGSFAAGLQADKTSDVTESRGYLWGAGLSFRRSCFLNIRECGFRFFTTGRSGKKLGSGEDSEICLAFIAAGYRLWVSEELQLGHYMPHSRLQWNHAIKMFKGFGDAEFILELYRNVIKMNSFPLLKIYFELIPYSVLYFGWRFVTLMKNHEGNSKYLSYLARRNYIVFALKNIGYAAGWSKDISRFCRLAANLQKKTWYADL